MTTTPDPVGDKNGAADWLAALDALHQPWYGQEGMNCQTCASPSPLVSTQVTDGTTTETFCCASAHAIARLKEASAP